MNGRTEDEDMVIKPDWMNNTNAVIEGNLLKIIQQAIKDGGVLPEDYADIFVLRCPAGVWIFDWA